MVGPGRVPASAGVGQRTPHRTLVGTPVSNGMDAPTRNGIDVPKWKCHRPLEPRGAVGVVSALSPRSGIGQRTAEDDLARGVHEPRELARRRRRCRIDLGPQPPGRHLDPRGPAVEQRVAAAGPLVGPGVQIARPCRRDEFTPGPLMQPSTLKTMESTHLLAMGCPPFRRSRSSRSHRRSCASRQRAWPASAQPCEGRRRPSACRRRAWPCQAT